MYTSRCTTKAYLRAFFSLKYINHLATDLKSNVKLFADDTSLFSIVSDPLETSTILNKDLDKIRGCGEQWKMAFNPEPTKQAQEVFFQKKPQESSHPNIYFNKFVVEKGQTQKHLGFKLDKKISFKEHLKDKFAKVNRGIRILEKLNGFLPCHSLITLYKSSIRPDLDYADIIYGQPNNLSLCNKIETCQYNTPLAITGAIGFEYYWCHRFRVLLVP